MSELSDAPPSQIQSIRRSVTLPIKLKSRTPRKSDTFGPSENDLFYHPSAKVVHFAPRAVAPIPSSTSPSDFDYPVDAVETLSWRSPTERTVAFAPLRLEKVHGLTVFLKCGNVVHAIMKNSQCWCVDGGSIFVLRIRPLTYYRIELPNEDDEDNEYVTAMKDALPKILRYEVTPCPFKRGFTVEIPQEAKVPRRKKAWRPKGRRESAPVYAGCIQEKSPTKKDTINDLLSAGEDTDGNTTDDSCFTNKGSTSTMLETIPDDSEPLTTSDIIEPDEIPRPSTTETQPTFETLLARFEDSCIPALDTEIPLSSSVESFHSFQSTSQLPDFEPTSAGSDSEPTEDAEQAPKPIFQKVDFSAKQALPEIQCHDCSLPRAERSPRASVSESEIKRALPCTLPDDDMSVVTESSSTRSSDNRSNSNLATMSIEFRRRSKASRIREVSPMPPASALVLPSDKEDAVSLIQKTYTLVLVPPIQLLIVLIHIAARIVIGPALDSAVGDLNRKFECQMANPNEAVDDFDIPLAPDRSKKPSVSAQGGKFDPWDLD
ncbi:hypothetical protein FE257_003237 [Aspergillus nanangensis]|uniref:Inheritance of peroxisomes protein 1 n=1 Tax=Aspergillus nanangensis TaxID=2582783 RepID=A0AAD4CSH7_ASPNN|nr:hypothetical protein FE257_003237 [Aspergillus nanangensis]